MIRKKFLTITIFLFSFTLIAANVFSQNTDKMQKTPEEFATKMAERMKKNLSLTDEQYKQVYNLALTNAQERFNNKEKYKSLDKETRKQMMKQNRENFKTQLQGILTKEQLQTMEENRKNHKHKSNKQKRELK